MPVAQMTVTARSGPAVQSTATVFTNVNAFECDVARQILLFRQAGSAVLKQFDLSLATTMTVALTAGGNWTITIS